MKLTTALTIAVVALVVGLLLEHHVDPLSSLIRLLHGPAASVEQDVANAGQKAAEDTKDELDAETDDAVAADSDVADQHAADAVERDAADQADEQRARDDLDRRLHDELLARTSQPIQPVSGVAVAGNITVSGSISDAHVDAYLADLRARLRQRVGLAPQGTGDAVQPVGDGSGG